MRGRYVRATAVFCLLSVMAACSGHRGTGVLPPSTQSGHKSAIRNATSDQYSAAILADGPTAYYRLDDTGSVAADSSGNALNGSIGSSVTIGAPGLLTVSGDTAVSLPGTASAAGAVTVPATAQLQPSAAVSLEAWIRFSAAPASFTVPVAYGNDNTFAPYDFYFYNGAIAAQFDLSSGALLVVAPTTLAPNTVYHIVSTFDGATGRLYVDGAQVASVAKTGTLTNYVPGYGLAIGDDAAFSDPAYKGTVDEIAVYAGKALSAQQVANHYKAGTVLQGTPTPSPTPTPTPTPTPIPTPTPTPGPSTSWPTMGYDIERTGYNPRENVIGTGSFGSFHQLWRKSVSGGMIGEPAYASGVSIAGVKTNVIYAGGFTGEMFALNADTGAKIWSKQLGTSSYMCGASGPFSFGIAGSPAVDRSRNRIYVGDGAAQVHSLSLSTGTEATGWPITIASPANQNFIYGGLTYNSVNKMLYVETSSTCDISPWNGRISAINTTTITTSGTFYPTQGTSGGGIWGFGGASIDPATNDVFVATGNADTTNGAPQNAFYAEQVIQLSSDVNTLIAHDFPGLPAGGNDLDFGATPLLFKPPGCPALLAAINKGGVFFLYNRASIGSGPTQAIQMSITTDNGDFVGVPAYDPVTHYVYVEQPATFGIYKPGVAAFKMQSGCTLDPTPVWAAQFGEDGAVSSDDTLRSPITIANGVLYISDYGTSQTYAFDASSGSQLWTQPLTSKASVGPIVVNGHLYVASNDGTLTAWGP